MHSISRRGFVISAAAASATFGLDGPLEFVSPAQAQGSLARANPSVGHFKYMVGDVEAFALHDGMVERPLPEVFVKNAKPEDVKAALAAAGDPEGKFINPFTTTALRMGNKTILIDTGTGGQLAPTAGQMMDNLKAAGVDPKSVSTILISHFHADHITGLMAKDTNAQIFPEAEILMPEVEYKFWTDPALIEKLPEAARGVPRRIQATFPTWKNIKQFKWGDTVAPGITALETPGHTAGHTSFLVASGGKQLIVQGDVSHLPYVFVKNPGWHVFFDADGQKAEESRRKLYDRAVADKAMICGYHWGFPNVGTIAKDGNGYAFTPVQG